MKSSIKIKYNNEKLTSLFPQTTDYYFQKMFEVIYTHSQHEHGLGCLELFEDNYKKLILKLKKMGEYPSNEVLVYEIGEVLYPIQKIKSFYKNEKDNTLNEKDASIFITFIVQQHSKILTLLEEIDQDYRSCNK